MYEYPQAQKLWPTESTHTHIQNTHRVIDLWSENVGMAKRKGRQQKEEKSGDYRWHNEVFSKQIAVAFW